VGRRARGAPCWSITWIPAASGPLRRTIFRTSKGSPSPFQSEQKVVRAQLARPLNAPAPKRTLLETSPDAGMIHQSVDVVLEILFFGSLSVREVPSALDKYPKPGACTFLCRALSKCKRSRLF